MMTFDRASPIVIHLHRHPLTHRGSDKFSWSLSVGSERSNSSIESEYLNDPVLYADLIALGLDPTTGTQAACGLPMSFAFRI